MRILILCTGNSCRSQMAYGFLQSFNDRINVFSAGTEPAKQINQKAVMVMKEAGIDISHQKPMLVDHYLHDEWDYVITVCDHAKETCPLFQGKVKNRLHLGFEDPSNATGSEELIMNEFRRIRDSIKDTFYKFYINELKPIL
ncbi:MAG: arsenate reductase ArsC [Bacteroidales bacterium]|nr:arsenate reductase ArsC [Bacteroidales bacterium]